MKYKILSILTAFNLLIWSSYYKKIIEIDPGLKNYTDFYSQLIDAVCPKLKKRYPRQVFVTFAKLPDPEIGLCMSSPFRFTILIDEHYYLNADENEKFQLVMHELGHCVLGLSHNSSQANYMYYSMNYLLKEDVLGQVIYDMYGVCEKQK